MDRLDTSLVVGLWTGRLVMMGPKVILGGEQAGEVLQVLTYRCGLFSLVVLRSTSFLCGDTTLILILFPVLGDTETLILS